MIALAKNAFNFIFIPKQEFLMYIEVDSGVSTHVVTPIRSSPAGTSIILLATFTLIQECLFWIRSELHSSNLS